jgi:hypothetical protein
MLAPVARVLTSTRMPSTLTSLVFPGKQLVIALMMIPTLSLAETAGFVSLIESEPISQIWLNPGFYSYHVQRARGLNDNNVGFGAEYRYSTTSSVSLGVYRNSDDLTSRYIGWYWQPLAVGPVRCGAVIGAIDGYHTWNGNWFIAAIPVASVELRNIGMNLLLIPTYQDKLYGSITIQVKIGIF